MNIRCGRIARALLLVSGLAGLLAACGGGDIPPPAKPPQTALTFSPDSVTTSIAPGLSKAFTVTATVNTPADFASATTVYAFITDTTGVIQPQVEITQDDDTFTATLHTNPALALGVYTGNFTVKICRDAACTQQFPGSPMLLPYKFTVTAQPMDVLFEGLLSNTFTIGAPTPLPFNAIVTAAENVNWSASVPFQTRWIQLSSASGAGNGKFVVSYNFTGLVAGTYTSNITVTGSDGQRLVIPMTVTLKASGG